MRPRSFQIKILAGAIVTAAIVTALASDVEKKPKYSAKEVMKEIHKGEDNVGKRVLKATASKEDIARMVEYYASLPLNDPPRGEKDSWLAKTTALVKASEEIKAGKPEALEHYKAAANCKACHEAHKPQEKK